MKRCCGDRDHERTARAALGVALDASAQVDFTPIVSMAYVEILGRPPDPGGLAHWNSEMQRGMREDQVREALVRSDEYAHNHPGGELPPDPPEPPLPGTMLPLRVDGNRFVTDAGPVLLLGMLVCCDDEATEGDEAHKLGWPWVTVAALDVMANSKLNYTECRLGPMSHSEPNKVQLYRTVSMNDDGGKFDLTQWDEGNWARLLAVIAAAEARGIYLLIDLIDTWGLHHKVTPWSLQRNIQGIDADGLDVTQSGPQPIHQAWIRECVRRTARYNNVLYQIGNEEHKTVGTVWSEGCIEIAKDELRRLGISRPVGSNNEERPPTADFWTFHQQAAEPASTKPIMVNEYSYDHGFNREAVLTQVRRGRDMGTSFHFWSGPLPMADRAWVLDGMEAIIEGAPPPPVADSCPQIARTGSKLHVLHRGGTIYDTKDFPPQQIGTLRKYPPLPNQAIAVFDCTYRFGDGRGLPCNDEHGRDPCGGRDCEDPRGPIWTLLEQPGGVDSKVDGGNPYLFHVGPMNPGHYRLRCEARSPSLDALGKPVNVAGNAATECTWTV